MESKQPANVSLEWQIWWMLFYTCHFLGRETTFGWPQFPMKRKWRHEASPFRATKGFHKSIWLFSGRDNFGLWSLDQFCPEKSHVHFTFPEGAGIFMDAKQSPNDRTNNLKFQYRCDTLCSLQSCFTTQESGKHKRASIRSVTLMMQGMLASLALKSFNKPKNPLAYSQ